MPKSQSSFHGRFVTLCLACLITFSVSAQEKFDLVPGKHFVVPMPELGPTWDKKQGRFGVRLPTNYTPDKQFPAIVYFGGGNGSDNAGFYGNMLKDDWVFICLTYPSDGRGWGADMDWYKPMIDKAHQVVPNINTDLIIASGFSSGGGASSHLIQTYAGMSYFCAAIPTGLATVPRTFPKTPKQRGFPLLVVIGENDTQHDRLGWCKKYYENAKNQGLDAEIYIEKGVGHSVKGQAKKKINEWIQAKVLQPYLDERFQSIEERFGAAKTEEAMRQITSLQQQVIVDSPAMNKKIEVMLASLIEKGGEALEKIKLKPTQPKLAAFLEQWHGTPLYDQAMVVYDELAQGEVDALLALEPELRKRRMKFVIMDYAGCKAIESLMPVYNEQAAAEYAELMKGFRDTQHRQLATFVKDWPNSESAADAQAKRLAIAIKEMERIQKTKSESSRKMRMRRFDRDFGDLANHESIQALVE